MMNRYLIALSLVLLGLAAADFTAEVQTFVAEAQNSDPVVENIDELLLAVEKASTPAEFGTVKELLTKLQMRLTEEYKSHSAKANAQIVELEKAIDTRTALTKKFLDEISTLQAGLTVRNKNREVEVQLIVKMRGVCNEKLQQKKTQVNDLEVSKKLDLKNINPETIDIKSTLDLLLAHNLNDSPAEEIEEILKLLKTFEERIKNEASTDPAISEIDDLKIKIGTLKVHSDKDKKSIQEVEADAADNKQYYNKFVELINEVLAKLNEMSLHAATVNWNLNGTSTASPSTGGVKSNVTTPSTSPAVSEDCTELQKKRDALVKENEALKKDNDRLAKEIADALKALDECRKNHEKIKKELEECRKNHKECELDKGCEQCAKDLDECNKTNDKCQKDLKECTDGWEDCKKKNKELEDALEKCNKDFKECQGDLDKCRKDLELCKADVLKCNNKLSELKVDCAKWQEELEKCLADLKDCTSYEAFKKHINEELVKIVKGNQADLTKSREEKDSIKKGNAKVRGELRTCMAGDEQDKEAAAKDANQGDGVSTEMIEERRREMSVESEEAEEAKDLADLKAELQDELQASATDEEAETAADAMSDDAAIEEDLMVSAGSTAGSESSEQEDISAQLTTEAADEAEDLAQLTS